MPTPSAPPRPFDVCVGLGYHCEVTHQLRRITGDERAAFFDWLDLELASVVETIDSDFREVLRPGAVEPFSDGHCALDRGSDIRFFHDFAPSASGRLSAADIEKQLPQIRVKFEHLAERFRARAASPDRVLYVHHDAFDESEARDLRRLRATIAAAHPHHRFALLWVRRTPPRDAGTLPPGVGWDTTPLVPGRWQGDDAAWDGVFRRLDPAHLWP
ncbi:DUF1796 family putative cysteine peptidase [Streptomyces spiramenti]|uniref:Papain-like cysteine peptidase n=1 Tax=Streptomyces spiramenti TaxID=2720606 RepID=A0ABX1ASV5_9ACTN|nr:DUF1796 family putative cysteine peptidase [Streptomyces spiramenti]NJP68884.1 papain-like cysteine peptidase [Streptomyces spiramenti]